MLQKIVRFIGGDPNKKEIERLSGLVSQINSLEPAYEKLSDEALRAKTDEFKARLAEGATLDSLIPEAFAAVREASKRTNEQRPFDVQLIGGAVLNQGKIAEMRTGEGKTLVATLPIYLNALTGRGVHLVTVNDYLARRDARWMGAIYTFLGLSIGVLQMAARTENGKNAFLVDLERRSPHEDQDQLRMVLRVEAYRADITYGTNSEFGFDYLRDNLAMRLTDRVQRGHYFAIVDEVDNILIDEARTPLIISGPASEDTEWYARMAQVVKQLNPEDYEVEEKDRTVTLNEIGEAHVEQLLDTPLRDPERPEDITPEQARLLGYLEKALQAQFLYRRNKDYLVQNGKVVIVDEFTGRLMPGRRWSEGLHQAVEAKEGVKVEPENVTYATITLQNYFRKYEKLAGMTGTALTEAEEFYKIYKLDVLPIPTNLEHQAAGKESPLIEVESRDDQGYRFSYFAQRGADEKQPVYWRRKDFPDIVYRSEEAKRRAIVKEIIYFSVKGRPQLVGTTSVEHSERLSEYLSAESVRRLLQTMLIRQAWLEKNNRQDDEQSIPELKPLWQPITALQAADLRQLAKPLGLNSINPEDEMNLPKVITLLNLEPGDQPRLASLFQGGVQHQVLNARKHDEESQIIAGAGAFGAVTIATNMAGRGVDIKLGGELPEGSLAGVNRILARTGSSDPYEMTMEEREGALKVLTPEDYGIYEADAGTFLTYMENSRRVRLLGGLHVIGSERHEARRIDNQLRGRAARQGDPGSSRFYLSLDDELMRLFGGGQVEGLMSRLKIDEAIPIESGMVGRLVEQSQSRVEGANFDVRKHLLEYDDVLNAQRERIYAQRDRIFQKNDLHEDVTELLHTELQQRIPESLNDSEGPWKLLAYLDEVQPPLDVSGVVFPSYGYRLILEEIGEVKTAVELRSRLLKIADDAYKAEREHLLNAIRTLLEKTEDSLKAQIQEREDGLDTFIEGKKEAAKSKDEESTSLARRPQEIQDELIAAIRTPVRLNGPQLRQIAVNPEALADELRAQISVFVTGMIVSRLVNTIERRIEEALPSKPAQLLVLPYREIADRLYQEIDELLEQRARRLLGDQGQIARDLDSDPERLHRAVSEPTERTRLLNLMAQGTKLSFDAKTHRRGFTVTTRLRYPYRAAQLIEQGNPPAITESVLNHLEEAEIQVAKVWGLAEWNRIDRLTVTVSMLDNLTQQQLEEVWGKEGMKELLEIPLAELHPDNQDELIKILGQRIQNEIYRQLLLNVISDLWVDYLTRVEALRVSIGLEAYAQRDPLVQYKARASEMFTVLLREIRAGVISRMFTYRPRQPVAAERPEARVEGEPPPTALPGAVQQSRQLTDGGGKKKKRKRH